MKPPDSSGILLPLQGDDEVTRIHVLGVDGDDRLLVEGIHATWAP